MRIISNLNEESHNEIIKKFFEQSEEIYIASPFLMPDFNEFFNSLKLDNLKKITLITTLKEKDVDQLNKAKSFKSILEILKSKNIEFNLLIDNKLHGKVYLFRKNNENIVGIVTSANFTDNGLEKNHEYGVEINDKDQLNKLSKLIFYSNDKLQLSENDICYIINKCDDFNKNNKKDINNNNHIGLNLISSIKENKIYTKGNYWLKPLGVTGSPVKYNQKFNLSPERLDFSKKKPSGISKDDIIITYGIGVTGKILSVYKSSSLIPRYVSTQELINEPWRNRWPWSIEAINLFQKYGEEWFKYDINIYKLKDEFLNQFPNESITQAGGKTLGCLNRGLDKVRLTENFAKYLISKVSEIEDNLALSPQQQA